MKRLLFPSLVFVGFMMCFCSLAFSQVTEEWVSNFDGKGNVDEYASAMTTDASGNVYVTGAMPALSGSSQDAITMKINKFGTILWRERYRAKYGSSNGKAIAVDGAGNVYVAGNARGVSNTDFLLIKYTPAGDTVWTRQRNGPENGYDDVAGLVINAAGNIWVTGQSGFATTDNIMTVIYDADGNELSTVSYTVNGSSKEQVNAISTDATGNVYITGLTYTTGNLDSRDVLTLKYSAVGSLVWAKIYNGVTNNYDVGNKVIVDLSGNVYVIGASTKNIQFATRNALTIKYNALGDTVWVRRYDGGQNGADGNDIVADASGNVYITGTSRDNVSALFIVKYNTAGDTVWTRTFSGNGTITAGKSIGLDISGNIFVGGNMTTEIAFLKYSPTGNKLWNQSYKGSLSGSDQLVSLKVAPSGNVTIAGQIYQPGSGNDIVTARFDSTGTMNWESIYQSSGNSQDQANACTIDKKGNFYVTGTAILNSYIQVVTVKFNSSGDTVWTRGYNYNGGFSSPFAITTDDRGNVYVACECWTSSVNTSADIFVVKYNPDGVLKWVAQYVNGSYDRPQALTVDGSGNVYVTGQSYGSGNWDYVTLKYDSTGTQQWFPKRYNASGSSGADQAFAITVDKIGNVYVTGISAPTVNFLPSEIATIKYNAAGTQQWVKRFKGTQNFYNEGTGIAVDDSGNIYVGGMVEDFNSEGGDNMIVIKYNAIGDTLWTARYDGPYHSIDIAHALVLDRQGNVIITGVTINPGPNHDYDYATVKFNSKGVLKWAMQYDGGNLEDEYASSLAVDTVGNVYVTGSGERGGLTLGVQPKRIVTIRYSPLGVEDWVETYMGSANFGARGLGIALDAFGNVYVGGDAVELKNNGMDQNRDIIAIKYQQNIPLSVGAKLKSGVPDQFELVQNYPNPFNPTTVISYQIPVSNHITLRVYDAIGREVAILVNEVKEAGYYSVSFNASNLASGIYFARLVSGEKSQVKKLMLMK